MSLIPESPPKRVKSVRRLPMKHIELIDECAASVAQSRSGFLQNFLDTYHEHIITFTEGWLAKDRKVEEDEKKKVMLVLAEHSVDLIRECSKAIGKSEEEFLQIILDNFKERMLDFREEWYTKISYNREKVLRNSKLTEAKKAARAMGMSLAGQS
jgi:hypothetical protein